MQDQASVTPAYDLGHYLRPLARHRSLLALALAIGLVLGIAYTVIGGRTYTSTAAVLINNAPSIPGQVTSVNPTTGRTNGSVNLDTEAQLVKSSSVLVRAQAAMHTTASVGSIRGRIDIVVPPNSTVLRISCTGSHPTSAQTCARAVATAYLANREAANKAAVAFAVNGFRQQLDQVKAALLQDATDIQNSPPASAARNNAFARQDSDKTNRNAINTALNQLATANTTPGTIISAAAPGTASKFKLVTGPLGGLILGLIVGLATVYIRERRDKFVRHVDDLLRCGVPLIATSDRTRARARSATSERAARTRFEQRIASVVAGAFDDDGGVVYIAPVSPNQSPDRIARRLASTLASVGHSVELVRADDVADVPKPAAKPTSVPPPAPLFEPGETGGSALGWPASPGADDELPAAPVDSTPPLIDESFATDPAPISIPQLIEDSRRRAQFVIIEGEPAATDAQAYILTGLSDAALLIVDPQVTTRTDLEEVVDQIAITGSELLGAVIWRLNRKQPAVASSASDDTAAAGDADGKPKPSHSVNAAR